MDSVSPFKLSTWALVGIVLVSLFVLGGLAAAILFTIRRRSAYYATTSPSASTEKLNRRMKRHNMFKKKKHSPEYQSQHYYDDQHHNHNHTAIPVTLYDPSTSDPFADPFARHTTKFGDSALANAIARARARTSEILLPSVPAPAPAHVPLAPRTESVVSRPTSFLGHGRHSFDIDVELALPEAAVWHERPVRPPSPPVHSVLDLGTNNFFIVGESSDCHSDSERNSIISTVSPCHAHSDIERLAPSRRGVPF